MIRFSPRLLTHAILGSLAVSACSGSVLFDEKNPRPVPVLEPVGPGPTNEPEDTAVVTPRPTSMTLVVSQLQGWNLLFPELKAEQEDLQTLPETIDFEFRTRSLSVDESKLENHLSASFKTRLSYANQNYESVAFVTAQPLIAKNEGSKDILSGEFTNPKDPTIKIRILAEREASPTLELARRNPWKGRIVISGTNPVELGVIEGISEYKSETE
jgi:hypothetical protein